MAAKKEYVGTTSIGVGAFLIVLGILFISLTYINYIQNQDWIFAGLNNYIVSSIGALIGIILLGYGIHTRTVMRHYVKKVEKLTEYKEKEQERLAQKDKRFFSVRGKLGVREKKLKKIERMVRSHKKKSK